MIHGVFLTGEAAYYARRIAFVLLTMMGSALLVTGMDGDLEKLTWGVIMLAFGCFGIWAFGLRRYPRGESVYLSPSADLPHVKVGSMPRALQDVPVDPAKLDEIAAKLRGVSVVRVSDSAGGVVVSNPGALPGEKQANTIR